jgi:hypothetical protein
MPRWHLVPNVANGGSRIVEQNKAAIFFKSPLDNDKPGEMSNGMAEIGSVGVIEWLIAMLTLVIMTTTYCVYRHRDTLNRIWMMMCLMYSRRHAIIELSQYISQSIVDGEGNVGTRKPPRPHDAFGTTVPSNARTMEFKVD